MLKDMSDDCRVFAILIMCVAFVIAAGMFLYTVRDMVRTQAIAEVLHGSTDPVGAAIAMGQIECHGENVMLCANYRRSN